MEEGVSFGLNLLSYNNSGSYDKSSSAVYTSTSSGLEENTVLSNALTTYDYASMRINEPQGLRVKASVDAVLHLNEDVEEYGFVISKKSTIDDGKIYDLVLSDDYIASKHVVYGKAFSRSKNIHKVFESDDTTEFFTAVLINVPKNKDALTTQLVFRPYIKLSDGSLIYGSKIQRSIHHVALALYYSTDDDSVKEATKEILDICGYELDDEIGINIDSLYK